MPKQILIIIKGFVVISESVAAKDFQRFSLLLVQDPIVKRKVAVKFGITFLNVLKLDVTSKSRK